MTVALGLRQAAADLIGPARGAMAHTLGALFVLNTMNYMDRQLFGVTQELIKRDLVLSDFELGLVGGPAFAILYILAAFPIARLSECFNRALSRSYRCTQALNERSRFRFRGRHLCHKRINTFPKFELPIGL